MMPARPLSGGAPAWRDARWVRIGCRERPKGVFLEFKVGDKVIYPNHGVGIIEKIQSRVLSGEERTFYTLRILSTDSTVMIPVANTGTVGLRKVLSKKDIEDIFGSLRTDKISVYGDWKGRFQENSDRMRSGEISQVADVLK